MTAFAIKFSQIFSVEAYFIGYLCQLVRGTKPLSPQPHTISVLLLDELKI